MNYKPWTNPGDRAYGTVSVIQTNDKRAKRPVAKGLFCTCYRVITPAQARQRRSKSARYSRVISCAAQDHPLSLSSTTSSKVAD
jgi:hypothetical protein